MPQVDYSHIPRNESENLRRGAGNSSPAQTRPVDRIDRAVAAARQVPVTYARSYGVPPDHNFSRTRGARRGVVIALSAIIFAALIGVYMSSLTKDSSPSATQIVHIAAQNSPAASQKVPLSESFIKPAKTANSRVSTASVSNPPATQTRVVEATPIKRRATQEYVATTGTVVSRRTEIEAKQAAQMKASFQNGRWND